METGKKEQPIAAEGLATGAEEEGLSGRAKMIRMEKGEAGENIGEIRGAGREAYFQRACYHHQHRTNLPYSMAFCDSSAHSVL